MREDLTVWDLGMVGGADLMIPKLVRCRNPKKNRHRETYTMTWINEVTYKTTYHLLSASFHKGKGLYYQGRQRVASHQEGHFLS